MSIRFCSLASGSAGNATFIASNSTRLLVDDGLSMKELTRRLNSIGEDLERLDAILVTHEHSDHVGGLPVLARNKKLRGPIYMTETTAKQITWDTDPRLEYFQPGDVFRVGDIAVIPFSVPHDAVDPVGFRFEIPAGAGPGIALAVLTDLGHMTELVRSHLQRTDLLMIESNHDLEMLKVGPHPWAVKQRVMSRLGHLSNDATLEFLENGMDRSISHLILGHLSDKNNSPELVRLLAARSLDKRGIRPALAIAEQNRSSEVFEL